MLRVYNKLSRLVMKGLHDINIEVYPREAVKIVSYLLENAEVKLGYDKKNKTPVAKVTFKLD